MRSPETPYAAERLYQFACAAGLKAAEMMLAEKLLHSGGESGEMPLDNVVRSVVDAAFEDAGSRLANLVFAVDNPFPPGSSQRRAYGVAVSDIGHMLGACPAHKGDVVKLRLRESN